MSRHSKRSKRDKRKKAPAQRVSQSVNCLSISTADSHSTRFAKLLEHCRLQDIQEQVTIRRLQLWLDGCVDDFYALPLFQYHTHIYAALIKGYLKILLRIVLPLDPLNLESNPFTESNRLTVEVIGSDLNQWGGYHLMLGVANQIPKGFQRDLE